AKGEKAEKAAKVEGTKERNGQDRDGRTAGHDGHDGKNGRATTGETKGRKARVGEGASAADRLAALDPGELREDLRLACISRAIDDREISLQKQSRVFFQISGAGHEALYLGFARELRAGYDWFFPYYRDLALVLGLGV